LEDVVLGQEGRKVVRFVVPARGKARRGRGQSLAEFAIVFPIMFLIVAAIIQFGLIFWAQNTLTQIARDTGRWAATQQANPCNTGSAAVVTTANQIAANSALLGYSAGSPWTNGTNVVTAWTTTSGTCPPTSNQEVSYVRITLNHQVPVFFPFLPVSGNLTTSAEFRMEPVAD
jgi:Flp pilus assembly protein TadG